ncbi:MAG: tetratricopeptide repeat protein [Pseudomonadota bacterium]
MDDQPRHSWVLFKQWAIVAVLTILAYTPTFTGGFLLDDHVLIENNTFIRQIRSPSDYFSQEDGILDRDQWQGDYHTGYYRPLVSLSYALDYRLWGNNPIGFRTTNLILHLFVCLALLALLHRHLTDGWQSVAAVLIFALHPVNTEAVAWISSRNNIMAALFSMLALLFYAERDPGRATVNRFMALLCFTLALLSKEYGVMVLPILFVWNRTFDAGRQRPGAELAGYLPFCAVLIGYFWLRVSATGAVLSPNAGADIFVRLLSVPYLILYNLRLVFLPVGLHSFSIHYPSDGIFWDVAASLAGLAMVCLLLWRLRRNRAVIMGTLSFLLGLFPVLNIFPTSAVSLISMRWLYFPMAFFAIAFCPPAALPKWRRAGACLTALVIAGLTGYTLFLNQYLWHDEASFFEREVTVFGNLDYAGGLGELLHSRGDLATAEAYYQQGIAARTDMVDNHINYAALLIETGRPDRALAVLDTISDRFMSRENRGRLINNQAMALTRLGRVPQAVLLFEKAVSLAPGEPSFWGNLGSAYAMTGNYTDSAKALEKGLTLTPESAGLLANLALTRLNLNDPKSAAVIFARLPEAEKRKRPDLAARIDAGVKEAAPGASR